VDNYRSSATLPGKLARKPEIERCHWGLWQH
jgi:hypothetical protein